MADDELKVSPGLEDRLLDYAEKASETTGNHAAFVADMIEAAALVAAVRNIIESRGRYHGHFAIEPLAVGTIPDSGTVLH